MPCFRRAADQFGWPDEVLHDLSPTISGACEQALPGVAHRVCHQHLARDIGQDLYAVPQAALCKRIRTLKLQYRLKEQRRGQNEWLRQRLDSPADLVLAEVLADRTVAVSWDDTFSREIVDGHELDRPLAKIVLSHLDKYWEHLVPDPLPAPGQPWQRTTNQLESDWGTLKRRRRQTHGRGKLTRDFQSLPEEYPLIRNLENETYLQVVLGGSLDTLPDKLAEAGRDAGSFDAWRRRRRPRILGELPRRLLREDDFVEHLLHACIQSCEASAHRAA